MFMVVMKVCGRYFASNFNGVEERFDISELNMQLKPRYNIAPTQDVPVVINHGENVLAMLRWGLIPSWAKDISIGNKMINARAETLDEKTSFKIPLQRKRCLIVANGFYEWKKESAGKKPYLITLKNQELFGFAGLWDTWQSPEGKTINSCTIITISPNKLMESIHHRMPVILSKEGERFWLDSSITDMRFLKNLLLPYPAELMEAYEVSTLVNSPKNDVPECLQPVNTLF